MELRVQSGCQGLGTEIGTGWLMVINIQLRIRSQDLTYNTATRDPLQT